MSRRPPPDVTLLPATSGNFCLVPNQQPDGRRCYFRQPVVAWRVEDDGATATATPIVVNDLTPPGEWTVEDAYGVITSGDALWPSAASWAREQGLEPDPVVPEVEAVLWPERAA